MRYQKCILFLFFFLLVQTAFAQLNIKSLFSNQTEWTSGYQKSIRGETINYFSAYPDYVNQALLTRATDGQKVIEWQTAPVAKVNNDGYAYFRWVAGHSSGTNSADRHFDFYINGVKALTITTTKGNKNSNWAFENSDGVRIWFEKLKNDGANDAHGIAYLRIPSNQVKAGQVLTFKMIGRAERSNDWFMTFKYDFKERADFVSQPIVLKNGKQLFVANVLHFGKSENLKITLGDKENFSFKLAEGMNVFELPIDAVNKADSLKVKASYRGNVLFDAKILVKPVVQREIHFIHHSHTDIGYSHLQPEVEKIHIKNIRDALKMIELTKAYPDEAKFKWNVESLWAVENFLTVASNSEKETFFKAVKDGSIGLSAMYANMLTGLSMPEEMFEYTSYAQFLKNSYQLPINSAMASDVPGFAWGTVSALAKGGVKYFSSGPNEFDRIGNFNKTWGDNPVWWASPSGTEKVLFWVAGKGYSSWHGNKAGNIAENGLKKISDYLKELDAKSYPYKMIQWRYNIVADNAPIDSTISDFVKSWNEKYASPKIVLNTTAKMFEQFEKESGAQLKTVQGDITPYWEDGAASTALEEGLNRKNSLKLQQLNALYSILAPQQYPKVTVDSTWKNILLFHEHTWGAHSSISEPEAPFVTEQWRIKKQFASNADALVNKLEADLLKPLANNAYAKFAVVNTLSWVRGGLVYLPAGVQANSVTDEYGKSYPTQKLNDGRLVFYAERLNPLSVTKFTPSNNRETSRSQLNLNGNTISNGLISLEMDGKTGSVKSVENIEAYSFANSFKNQGLNGYWYVKGLDPQEISSSTAMTRKIEEVGPVLTQISFTGTAPGANKLTKRITLLAGDDKFYVQNTLDKTKATDKEAVYFSFPFATGLDSATVDAGYGAVTYGGSNQLAGSNRDFIPTKRWLDVSDQNKGVQIITTEAFMASPKIVDEQLVNGKKKWLDSAQKSSTWFMYAMNNYWHTNYKASQEGVASFDFVVRPHGKLKQLEQEKSAMEFAQPLVVFGTTENATFSKGLLQPTNNNVIITNIIPQTGGGYLLRMLNADSNVQATQIAFGSYRPQYLKNVETQQQLPLNASFQMQPLQVIEVLVK